MGSPCGNRSDGECVGVGICALSPRDLVTLEFSLRRIFGKSPVGRLWYEKRAKAVSNPYDLAYIDGVLAEPG